MSTKWLKGRCRSKPRVTSVRSHPSSYKWQIIKREHKRKARLTIRNRSSKNRGPYSLRVSLRFIRKGGVFPDSLEILTIYRAET